MTRVTRHARPIRHAAPDELPGALELGQRVADALERGGQVLARVRVAEAQVPLAVDAEGGPGEAAHAGVVEQVVGDLVARCARTTQTFGNV